jgi:hypothetical protein
MRSALRFPPLHEGQRPASQSALEAEAAGRPDVGSFNQPPIGPALFLRAKQLLEDWREHPQEFMAGQPP